MEFPEKIVNFIFKDIEPGSNHVFWTESDDPMEIIFLAWGKGA